MATRKPLFMATDGFSEEMADADDVVLGGLEMGGPIDMGANKITNAGAANAPGDALIWGQAGASLDGLAITASGIDMNGNPITTLGDPTADGDAATKNYVDQKVISGGTIKEPLHCLCQLSNTQGILAHSDVLFENQPVDGDTVTITDGTTSQTFTFRTSAGSLPDVQIAASVNDTMDNFASAINSDTTTSGVWGAVIDEGHADIGDYIVGINEETTVSGVLSTSRIYGTFTTQADLQVVEYQSGGEIIPYNEDEKTTASTTDPGEGKFGLSRSVSELTDGEIHLILSNETQWAWDGDDDQWNQLSGSGAIPDATSGPGGGIKGKVSADENYGLEIVNGVLRVDLAATPGLQFTGGDLDVLIEANKGLTKTAAGLAGVADTTAGMDVGANGFAVDLEATAPGLEFNGGDLQVKANGTTGAISVDGNGVRVKVETNKALSIGANGLAWVPDTTRGLDVDASGAFVDLATNPGLEFSGGDLQAKVNGATGAMAVDANGLYVKVDGNAGMEINANGVAVDLAASNPGLQFDGSGDLEVLADATRGISVDGSGLYASLDSDGGLQFDGGGAIGIKLDENPDTLDVTTSGLKVVGLPLQFKIDGTQVSSNLTASAASELVDGGVTTLHSHAGVAESGRVEKDFEVSETVNIADPVYLDGVNDRVARADAGDNAKAWVIGVARATQSTVGLTTPVVAIGEAVSVLSGATAGDRYYLQDGGGMGTTAPGGNRRVILCGMAINATDLWVRISDYGKRNNL